MAKQVNLELTTWNRFYTNNLVVVPEILGNSHVFTFEQREITISLPNAERLTNEPGRDEVLKVSGWRAKDDKILRVNVYKADVQVRIPGTIAIPEEALTEPANSPELFSEQQQQCLESLAKEYSGIATRAFDLWIKILRWKADDYRIGLPVLRGAESGWGTYIQEKETQKKVWIGSVVLTVRMEKAVTTEAWNEASEALRSGQSVPIFWDYLYDALAHLERGDLRRTIVDAAIAAETYMRTIVHEGLPASLDAPLKDFIDGAALNRVSSKFFPARLDVEQRKIYDTLKPDLNKLSDYRNTIMHSGQKEDLTEEGCRTLIESVRKLVILALDRTT